MREPVRSAFDHIQLYDRYLDDLPLLGCTQHLAAMKRAKTSKVLDHRPRCANQREVDLALVKFVEALAIADARRDHLCENERLVATHTDAAGEKRFSGDVQDEAGSNLCSVLDRASERKVD